VATPAASRPLGFSVLGTSELAGGPQVVAEVPADRNLCRRHHYRLHRDGTFLVTAQITRAQRAHNRLVRRRGHELATTSFLQAASILCDWYGGHYNRSFTVGGTIASTAWPCSTALALSGSGLRNRPRQERQLCSRIRLVQTMTHVVDGVHPSNGILGIEPDFL
jgi:hypothetical protein